MKEITREQKAAAIVSQPDNWQPRAGDYYVTTEPDDLTLCQIVTVSVGRVVTRYVDVDGVYYHKRKGFQTSGGRVRILVPREIVK